jgi:hypothetical protein
MNNQPKFVKLICTAATEASPCESNDDAKMHNAVICLLDVSKLVDFDGKLSAPKVFATIASEATQIVNNYRTALDIHPDEPNSGTILFYLDDENDKIIIGNEHDFKLFVDNQSKQDTTLKIYACYHTHFTSAVYF